MGRPSSPLLSDGSIYQWSGRTGGNATRLDMKREQGDMIQPCAVRHGVAYSLGCGVSGWWRYSRSPWLFIRARCTVSMARTLRRCRRLMADTRAMRAGRPTIRRTPRRAVHASVTAAVRRQSAASMPGPRQSSFRPRRRSASHGRTLASSQASARMRTRLPTAPLARAP
jgi:hypothetical protein